MRLHFSDGTSGRVYRETVIDRGATARPCVLVVEFRLRAVRGRGHALFRWESLLNTLLFAGFPGLVSKLWRLPTSAAATGAIWVGWPAARQGVRPRPVARARAGVGAGLDPLRCAARAAPRRAAGAAAGPGRHRGCGGLVAPGRGLMTGPARILVAGAGPAGLALALQAHDHGADVRVIDRRPEAFRPSRALIMHARTLEVLRPLAVTQALLGRADTAPAVDLHLGGRVVRIRLADLALPDTAFPHLTLIRQMDVETVIVGGPGRPWGRGGARHRAAAGARRALGAYGRFCGRGPRPRRPTSVSSPAATVRPARCGPRPASGGSAASTPSRSVLADVELDADLTGWRGPRRGRAARAAVRVPSRGACALAAAGNPARRYRSAAVRPARPADPPPNCRHSSTRPVWAPRSAALPGPHESEPQHRTAERFRHGGGLVLAGDAAHAYSPATGQGMNAAIQDERQPRLEARLRSIATRRQRDPARR